MSQFILVTRVQGLSDVLINVDAIESIVDLSGTGLKIMLKGGTFYHVKGNIHDIVKQMRGEENE